jgi:hypothetical protein
MNSRAEVYTTETSIKKQTATKNAVLDYVRTLGFEAQAMFAGSYWVIAIPEEAVCQTHGQFFGKLYLARWE